MMRMTKHKRHSVGRLFSVTILSMVTLSLVTLQQCKVGYSFSGVNISEEVETYSVEYFPNRAALVQAQLSQVFTDALMDKIQGNTSLDLSNSGGDVQFSGEITGYEMRPAAITSEETAARNRLTITVRVKYINVFDPDLDFDTNFSRYEEYNASQNLADVENDLILLIVSDLVEDIFNKAFISW